MQIFGKMMVQIFLLFFFLTAAGAVQASESELSLFEEIPLVITPGKKLQPINESPASVYVITQEDIKQSGSIHLWDVLRQVPGMDVMMTTTGQADVSMRGFLSPASNKTLVMVDGRSIYLPLQGLMLWEMIPVQLEEIERIEIVKGPVASLYGANANLGLINIITKKPDQMPGGKVTATGGTKTGRYAAMFGAGQDSVSYKFSTGWKDTDAFQARGRDAMDIFTANSMVHIELDDESRLTLSGGVADGDVNLLTADTMVAAEWFVGPLRNTQTYLKADYETGPIKSRIFWNYYHAAYNTEKLDQDIILNSVDAEISYSFDVGDDHAFITGGGGKFDHAEASLFDPANREDTQSQAAWNLFIQDDYRISERWSLNTSARLDHYPLSSLNPSARLALLHFPNKNDMYRISSAYSFRNPTLSDYYLTLPIDLTGMGFPISTNQGNKQLDPETYLTFETSYQGRRLDGKLRTFVDLFWTKVNDFISNFSDGGGVFGLDSTFVNAGRAYSVGGETGAEYDINDWLTLLLSYAFNHTQYDDTTDELISPKHKVDSGFKMKFFDNKVTAKLVTNYVSGTEYTLSSGLNKTAAYMIANLWVGYRPNDTLEVSISGYNVFHDKHVQIIGGDIVDTRILGKVEFDF